jgi:hypothetical protein
MPRSCRPEFRRTVLDLAASGRKVAEAARLLGLRGQRLLTTPRTCPRDFRGTFRCVNQEGPDRSERGVPAGQG